MEGGKRVGAVRGEVEEEETAPGGRRGGEEVRRREGAEFQG